MDIGGGFTSKSCIHILSLCIIIYMYIPTFNYMYICIQSEPQIMCLCVIKYAMQCSSIDIVYIRPMKTSKVMYCFRVFRRAPKFLSDPKNDTTHLVNSRIVSERSSSTSPVTGITHTHRAVSCNSDRL